MSSSPQWRSEDDAVVWKCACGRDHADWYAALRCARCARWSEEQHGASAAGWYEERRGFSQRQEKEEMRDE